MEILVEPLVSHLFDGLFHVLASEEVRGFAKQLVGGVDSGLEELKTKLEMIEELLETAKDKQLTDRVLKRWLDNLQHWAYDAEDVLDEFAYEALRRRLKVQQQASSSNGSRFLCANFPGPLFNLKISSKIKKINNQLEKLSQPVMLELSGATSRIFTPRIKEESSGGPPGQIVRGRDEDEAKLVAMLKSDLPCGNKFRVIAIVGMGGIGKTTIAREVYHHKEPDGFKFEEKAWVRVSNNFDILTISKSLLQKLKSSIPSDLNRVQDSTSSIPSDLNGVQVELQKAVSGKKFLIVLDDVWEVKYNDWEKLTSPFKAGAPGSTMIVTTRHKHVAKIIRCSDSSTYHLPLLSDEDCKSLFRDYALADGTTVYAGQITETIYEKVVERCSGLPLAAKTLGGLLYSKSINTWAKLLDNKVWNSSEANDVLPVLRLSYLYLPPHLKRCFAYCAIFPEDYKFKEEELVLLWMAEGIIQPTDEQLGETCQYFHDLCSRSLFQKSGNYDYDSSYEMHDLVHNLAKSVFKKFNLSSEQDIIKLPECIERIRHFSYISGKIDEEKRFSGLEKLRSLRTFLPLLTRHFGYELNFISAKVIFDLLLQAKKLRVLFLKDTTSLIYLIQLEI